MAPLLVPPERHWVCSRCDQTHVTRQAGPHTPFHSCRGMAGLSVPFVEEGVKHKIEAIERGDYIGAEQVQTDGEGRPVMSVITTRDDGEDCTVYAPAATATAEE